MAVNDGGPAFPERENDGYGCPVTVGGMTLRDWFAGQAMVEGLRRANELFEKHDIDIPHESTADEAYQLADAMLAARNKEAS